MTMRPKKVEQPFFADSPGPSPSRLRGNRHDAPSPARFGRGVEKSSQRVSPVSPASPASVTKAKGVYDVRQVRSPGFLGTRAKAKAKVERDKLIAQDVRRSSVIQRDDDIGMELLDAPTKRTSRSGVDEEEDDDFFAQIDGYGSFHAKGGTVSSASETPTFAQSPTEDEAVREPLPSRSRTTKPSKTERSPPQASLFSSEESSPSPKVKEESQRPKQSYTKRNSNSWTPQDSPSPRARGVSSKFQEAPSKSEPSTKPKQRDMEFLRGKVPEVMMNFPPEDVTLTFEPLSTEDKEPQRAPDSESDAIFSQDLEDLPQALSLPEDPGSPQATDRSEKRNAKPLEVEPLPALKVQVTAPSSASPFTSPLSEAFSPDVKRGHRLSKVEDTSTTSASTSTPSGDSRFMSPSAASELSRSPFNDQEQANLKNQLEELEEQQKQIQSGLKEALQHHRRLWADELARCQQVSQELEKALEEERRQHAEQIKDWEQRLQSELNKKESQWREEATFSLQVGGHPYGPHSSGCPSPCFTHTAGHVFTGPRTFTLQPARCATKSCGFGASCARARFPAGRNTQQFAVEKDEAEGPELLGCYANRTSLPCADSNGSCCSLWLLEGHVPDSNAGALANVTNLDAELATSRRVFAGTCFVSITAGSSRRGSSHGTGGADDGNDGTHFTTAVETIPFRGRNHPVSRPMQVGGPSNLISSL